SDRAILLFNISFDVNRVPFLRMTDIVDCHVVMLTPKEWYLFEPLMQAQHILRSGLSLTLCHNPVLYTNWLTGERIGPACCIPCCGDSWCTGFQILLYGNPAVHLQACLFSQANRWPNAYTENNEI